RNSLAQEFLTTLVTNDVNYNAAQRRPHRRHKSIQHESSPVLVDVARHNRVHGKTDKSSVDGPHHQHAPCPERLQQRPQECSVTRENVLDRFQEVRLEVYAKAKCKREKVSRE